MSLDDQVVIYVGHDYPKNGRSYQFGCTVKMEKEQNIHMKSSPSESEYIEMRTKRGWNFFFFYFLFFLFLFFFIFIFFYFLFFFFLNFYFLIIFFLIDNTLGAPSLLLPSVQLNIRGGNLPVNDSNGISFLKIPINFIKSNL